MFFETPVSLIPETSPVRKIKEIDDIKGEEPLKKMVDDNATSPEEVEIPESNEKEIESDEKIVDENDSSDEKEGEEGEVVNEEEKEEDEDDGQDEEVEDVVEESKDERTKTDSSDENKDDVICIDDDKEDESSVEDLIQKHSIKELRLMCKEKGLTQGGSKNDLASRILNDSKSVSVINIIS